MRIGLTTGSKNLPDALAAYPSMQMCRVFGAAERGIPDWDGLSLTLLREARVTPWVSFKDWKSDSTAKAAINKWLDAMPPVFNEVWLTYHHEPEGDIISREFRRRWVLLGSWVRLHKFAERIRLVPVHTLYPSRHKIGDNYSTDWTQWIGVWQQWVPLDPRGRYVGDYMGWDCYLETTAAVYEAPESFFRVPVGACHQIGARLVVPELGALRVATDSMGTGRARWMTDCLLYLRHVQCQAVNWWNTIGSAGQDYKLTDAPSASVWRKATEGLI